TQPRDAARRSEAAFLTARAAELAADYASAAEWYGRSASSAAAPARARVLLAAGRAPEALSLLDTVARRRVRETDWGPLLEDVARSAGPDTASRALDGLLMRQGRHLPTGTRGRLLLADGDRLLNAGRPPAAPHLAGRLFVGFARTHPGSPFAPKALVAALAVLPDAHDSLVAALDARYPASPYTVALRGADSPAFAAAEDFLAQSLGVERE